MSHHNANTAARLTAADSALNAFLTARRNHAPDTDTKAREAAKWADGTRLANASRSARNKCPYVSEVVVIVSWPIVRCIDVREWPAAKKGAAHSCARWHGHVLSQLNHFEQGSAK